jgi:hypothetical protein
MEGLSPMNSMLLITTTTHQMKTMTKTLMKQLMILKVGVKMEQIQS